MKKNIRILIYILFIMLFIPFVVFLIATSIAGETYDDYSTTPTVNFNASRYTVYQNTTAQQMLYYLNAGYTLTGIGNRIRDLNESLLCRERNWALYSSGIYEKAGASESFPQSDAQNGYAKAYILVARRL